MLPCRALLEVPESMEMFGVMVQVFGRPVRGDFPGEDYHLFHAWLDSISDKGKELLKSDAQLRQYVADIRKEMASAIQDYQLLLNFVKAKQWDLASNYNLETMKRPLASLPGLSERARRSLSSAYFDRIIRHRILDFQQILQNWDPLN